VNRRAPVARALRWLLEADVRRLFETEGPARALDSDGIHEMRRATRRLRATLRGFRPYLDAHWNRGLMDEVRWLSREIGPARDLEVLRLRLVAGGEDEGDGWALLGVLEERRAGAEARIEELFASARFELLRERLCAAVENPWVRGELGERCRAALGRRVARMWRRVRRLARSIGRESSDEQYHAVRKRGKDLRSVLESFRPWLARKPRKAAKRLEKGLGRLVGVLGTRQDAVMTRRFLHEVARDLPAESEARAAVARRVAAEDREVARLGREARRAWRRMDRRRWMD
jgi:CHAD domain-containing protein